MSKVDPTLGTEVDLTGELTAEDQCCPIDLNLEGTIPGVFLSELSPMIYTELIVATRKTGTTNLIQTGSCVEICNYVYGFDIERHLFDPGKFESVRQIALLKNVVLANYYPYSRNFNTNELTAIDYSLALRPRLNVILLDVTFSANEQQRVLDHLSATREVLPSRVAR